MGLRGGGNFVMFFRRALYNCFVGVRAVTGQRPHGRLIRGLDGICRGARRKVLCGCRGLWADG
jgi:hypothetical protein